MRINYIIDDKNILTKFIVLPELEPIKKTKLVEVKDSNGVVIGENVEEVIEYPVDTVVNPNLPIIEISEEDLKKLKVGFSKIINNQITLNYDKYLEYLNAKSELGDIKVWFQTNDWKVNKIVIGEWETTDSRWQEYLAQRNAKRQRQDELNALIDTYKK